MAESSVIKNFDQKVTEYKAYDFTSIYRVNLGTESLSEVKSLIEDITQKLNKIDLVKTKASNNLLTQITRCVAEIVSVCNSIKIYDVTQFISNKNDSIYRIDQVHEKLLMVWPSILALLTEDEKIKGYDDILKFFSEQVKNLTEKSEADAKVIEEIKLKYTTEFENLENRYKESISKFELVKQEDIFTKNASDYKKNARKWLLGIIAAFAFLVFTLWFIFRYFCFELSCFQNIQGLNYNAICTDCNRLILYLEIFKAVAYRLFIISLIIYIISFCVKNYNACMHNFTVNSHKANSFLAALALIEKAKTDAGNDIIMGQASNAIFSHQPTGFNSKDPENIGVSMAEKIIDKINPTSK